MNETIKYGIKSVGHVVQEVERKVVTPQGDLQALFKEFLDEKDVRGCNAFAERDDETYERAQKTLDKLKRTVSIDEAHALLVTFQDHPAFKPKAGYFVSVLYNCAPERVIIFDLELEHAPMDLAYCLSAEKVFVNRKKLWLMTGDNAKGLLINYGETTAFGWASSAKLLNYGSVSTLGGSFSDISSVSLAINAGIAGANFGRWGRGVAIDFGKTDDVDAHHEESLTIAAGNSQPKIRNLHGDTNLGRIVCFQKPKIEGPPQERRILHPNDVDRVIGLREYIDKIREKIELGRNDVDKSIEAMDSLNAETIKKDLEAMIQKAGVSWR